jgi:hypothetical protein
MKHEMIKNEECNNYLPPLLAGWLAGSLAVVLWWRYRPWLMLMPEVGNVGLLVLLLSARAMTLNDNEQRCVGCSGAALFG